MTDFIKIFKSNLIKIRPVSAKLLHVDEETDRQTDGQTDRKTVVKKLLVIFRNFSIAPKNDPKLQVSDFSLRCVGKLLCSGMWLWVKV